MDKYLGGVQVGRDGSVFFYEELSLYKVNGEYYLVNHDKNGLPSMRNIREGKVSPLWKVHKVEQSVAEVFADAMFFLQENRGKNLGAYSSVYTFCKLNGVDLLEDGYLSAKDEFI